MHYLPKIRDLLSYVPWIPQLLYYEIVDPCTASGGNHVVPFSVAINCYNSFPLTYSQEKDTLNTLVSLSDLDVRGRNIRDALNKIKERNHLTAHGFHKDIKITYNNFLDISYKYSSECFSTFEFVHPFPIELVNNEFQIAKNFRHHPKLIKEWISFEIEIGKYTACKVIEINGIPVFDFLNEYSQAHVGSTPDSQARLVLTLARAKFQHGKWVIEEGSFSRTLIAPDKPYLKLTIIYVDKPIKIKAPYLVISPKNFDSRDTFYSQNCLKARNSSSEFSPYFCLPKNQSLFWDQQLSIHKHKGTGILKIEEFKKETPMIQVKNIVSALEMLKQHNIKSLILDLSDTTGNSACMAQLLMKTLFNKSTEIWFRFRHAPLMDAMISRVKTNKFLNSSFIFENEYASLASFLKTKFHYFSTSFFTYTPPLQEKCPQGAKFVPGLIPNSIAVMTNGICFGACALFVSEVSSLPQVKAFKVSGIEHSAARLGSSPDYGLHDLTQVIDEMGSIQDASKYALPTQFSSAIKLYIPVRDYILKSGSAIRLQPQLAHHHILHPATSLPDHAWDQVSRMMA